MPVPAIADAPAEQSTLDRGRSFDHFQRLLQLPALGLRCYLSVAISYLRNLEARVGIEPTHKGFADLSLTTWVPRLWVGYSLEAPLNCK
jgi:hypothetical protein